MDTISEEGWIKLYRKSIHSQVFQNEGLWKVWTWCLMKANHQDQWTSIRTGRGMTEVFVKRGQFIFGRKTASKELKMKPPTVQKRIVKLKNMQNLITQSNSHFSIISICNYNFYQDHEAGEVSPKVSGKYQASITNKNEKNEKINNKEQADAPFVVPSKEEIEEGSDIMILDLVEKISLQLYEQKIFPEVNAFKNKMLKEKKNPRSILHTLCRAYFKREFDEGPWAYCQSIIEIEDKKYNARDYRKTLVTEDLTFDSIKEAIAKR
jgi:hypothetical protein